ncbi:hypothetical protein ACU4GD_21335 [Cupriavidus basilensis]
MFAAGFGFRFAGRCQRAVRGLPAPPDCRATGVAWANGVGRMGSVVGSVGGGTMLSLGLTMPALFLLVGIPAVIAGATMLRFGASSRGPGAHMAVAA